MRLLLGVTLAIACALPPAAGAVPQQGQISADSLRTLLSALRRDPLGVRVTKPEAVIQGRRTIAAGERVKGDVVTAGGDLEIFGTIEGNAVALEGDVLLRSGAAIGGDAISIGGMVRNEGATVSGEMRSLTGPIGIAPASARQRTPVQATAHALLLAVAWFAILAFIGFGVLLFARSNLEGIAESIESGFSRAFLVGLVSEIALLPALLVTLLVLFVTVIGWLLIPFAIVGFLVTIAGGLTLGFLGMAHVTGESLRRRAGLAGARGGSARYLFAGLTFFLGLWLLAAVFTWNALLGGLLGAIAGIVTWVAITVGFGATLLSRGGTRESAPNDVAPALDEYEWQTPTPVTGVAAARRPTPAARSREY